MSDGLETVLGLVLAQGHRICSVVGGGGKSSFILKASSFLRRQGVRFIVSTTTKMWLWQVSDIGDVIALTEIFKSNIAKFGTRGHFCVVGSVTGEKVKGLSIKEACTLFSLFPEHRILLEADGSKGMPLKGHLKGEPVIPDASGLVVGIIGLDSLGRAVKEVVFRPEEFARLYNVDLSDKIGLDLIMWHINHPLGLFKGAPQNAKRLVIFNKLDLFEGKRRQKLVDSLLRLPLRVEYCAIGSIKKGEAILKGHEGTSTDYK